MQTKQVPIQSLHSDNDSGCVEEITPGRNSDSSTEPSEDVTSKSKPPVLRIFSPSTEGSDMPPLPSTPGRAVRVFSDPQPNPPPHVDSTDEMLAIMGALDGQQDCNQDNVGISPSLHKLLMNPEVMNFKLCQSYNADECDNSSMHRDINTPHFLKIRVASHAYHTFVPTVGIGPNATRRGEAKVLTHTKTEFSFAIPSERQVTNFVYT